jgi:hypothetical protein
MLQYTVDPTACRDQNDASMDRAEVTHIADFVNDVYEGICEGDDVTTMQMQLTEPYRVIRLLMDETFKAQDQDFKVLLASLEYRAMQYKQTLEERLGVRNWDEHY